MSKHLLNFFHRNIQVRGVENALAVFYHQNLWGLMEDFEPGGDFVGNMAVANQVEVKWLDLRSGKIPTAFQSVLCHKANAASGTVLENKAGNLVGALNDGVNFSG